MYLRKTIGFLALFTGLCVSVFAMDSGSETALLTDFTTTVVIPDSITSIENEAFYGCNRLTSVTIPNSVTSIEKWAFVACTGLTSVTIPDSVTSIGDWAFAWCSSLKQITVVSNGGNPAYIQKHLDEFELIFK